VPPSLGISLGMAAFCGRPETRLLAIKNMPFKQETFIIGRIKNSVSVAINSFSAHH
jgi:hypothetical protein